LGYHSECSEDDILVDIWSLSPLVAVGAALIVAFGRRRWRHPLDRLLADLAFYVYIVGVVAVTLLPLNFERGFIDAMRQGAPLTSGINLVPFSGLSPAAEGGRQLLANVILGIPFGVGLRFLLMAPGRRALIAGLGFSLGIEGLQLAEDLVYGFPYRTVDVTDAILNFTGVVVGLAMFHIARVFYRWLGVDEAEVGAYIHSVFAARVGK
jgi:glycopeptide antibiotics resistance protein